MKVYVEPLVVAGTERGGEDLSLVFRAESDSRPNLATITLDDIEIALEGDMWQFREEDATPGDPEVWLRTDHYEIEWEGSREDLKHMVLGWIRSKMYWSSNFDGDLFSFKYEEFIDGNAE